MVEEEWKGAKRLVRYTYYVPKYEFSPQCVISKYIAQVIELIKPVLFYHRIPFPATTPLYLKNCNVRSYSGNSGICT
jgi:hypothetical protein